MRHFAREQYQWRALGYNLDGNPNPVQQITKGPWRHTSAEAIVDAQAIERDHVVVQKVRIGLTKIVATIVVKGPLQTGLDVQVMDQLGSSHGNR